MLTGKTRFRLSWLFHKCILQVEEKRIDYDDITGGEEYTAFRDARYSDMEELRERRREMQEARLKVDDLTGVAVEDEVIALRATVKKARKTPKKPRKKAKAVKKTR